MKNKKKTTTLLFFESYKLFKINCWWLLFFVIFMHFFFLLNLFCACHFEIFCEVHPIFQRKLHVYFIDVCFTNLLKNSFHGIFFENSFFFISRFSQSFFNEANLFWFVESFVFPKECIQC